MPPGGKKTRTLPALIATSLLALALVALWQWKFKPSTNSPSRSVDDPGWRTTPNTDVSASGSLFHNTLGLLSASTDSRASRSVLNDLRSHLAFMPPASAAAAIRQFLDSKADAPTHLGFKVAANGSLESAPTLRTFLMDELARLDPAAAAAYARVILASKDSPDEWALALRDLARGDTSASALDLLQQKTAEMIEYDPWQKNPSTGFLEAFDTAVYLGGTNLIPDLSGLVRLQDNPAVANAAFLALDRLVMANPGAMLGALADFPGLMQGRESVRADYFARADIRDPEQRQIVENYLLNPNLGAAELSTFAGTFPNANFMISHNLLTTTITPDRAFLTSLEAGSLNVVQQWMADPRFKNLAPQLQLISSRLQVFVQQAKSQ